MDYSTSFPSKDSRASTKKLARRRPLNTCGLTILDIIDKAYKKAQDVQGPVGSMTKRAATLAKPAIPIICALLYLWLTLLAFADDRILALEKKIEALFPPAVHLFNKIDELVRIVEILPENFDDLVYRFPAIVHQIPPLDWALSIVIWWLSPLVTVLNNWGSDCTREKEIMVDVNCNVEDNADESMMSLGHLSDDNSEIFCSASSDAIEEDNKANGAAAEFGSMRCSYKEALVQGINEQTSEKENAEEIDDAEERVMEAVIKSNDGKGRDLRILELFESGWHMTPNKGDKNSMKHSFSWT
ncbi:hypothetical protein RJ641_002644 [Dillenia turbinata]|uniref:Uncharacterized protein n=1 Tax=Dillenia turbinata TaxID=194707 RepID=A0AAN8VJE4_9MAGN